MSNRNVTAAKALEALHTLTSLAVPQPAKPEPFEYGAATGQFPMTDFNAPPSLIVWLFLVTNPDYLAQLDTAPFDGFNIVSTEDMANATNMKPAAVDSILDVYRRNGANNLPQTAITVQDAFMAVAQQFDNFTKTLGYPRPPHCLGRGDALIQLANHGSLVDPAAKAFPSLPA